MELKNLVPDIKVMFGEFEFLGQLEPKRKRDINGVVRNVKNCFRLSSSKNLTSDIIVEIPVKAGAKLFNWDDKVELINPVIIPSAYARGSYANVVYTLEAEDIVKVGGNK